MPCPRSEVTTSCPPPNWNEPPAGVGAAIDDIGGRFTMGYTTVVATAVKAGDTAAN